MLPHRRLLIQRLLVNQWERGGWGVVFEGGGVLGSRSSFIIMVLPFAQTDGRNGQTDGRVDGWRGRLASGARCFLGCLVSLVFSKTLLLVPCVPLFVAFPSLCIFCLFVCLARVVEAIFGDGLLGDRERRKKETGGCGSVGDVGLVLPVTPSFITWTEGREQSCLILSLYRLSQISPS